MNKTTVSTSHKPELYLVDLLLYISVMFLIREVYFSNAHFLVSGLFWTFTTLIVAIWRMRVRNTTWKDLGLTRPKNIKNTLLITGGILISVILSLVLFNIIIDQFNLFPPSEVLPQEDLAEQPSKFGDLKGNWWYFLSIMPFVLIESCLEELLDRGFLINWFERLFSKIGYETIIAVILQALIFGFRHSYDLSERSITVAIIGLIMGIAYVKFGRNLWPLIIAHCILNTMSMIDRV